VLVCTSCLSVCVQYTQPVSNRWADETYQLPQISNNVPTLLPPTTISSLQRPPPADKTHSASTGAGPLSSEMKYPEMHSVPHGGPTRASYRRPTRQGPSLPRPVTDDSRGQILAYNKTVRCPETRWHAVGLPPSDGEKHLWTAASAASELEYRVWISE